MTALISLSVVGVLITYFSFFYDFKYYKYSALDEKTYTPTMIESRLNKNWIRTMTQYFSSEFEADYMQSHEDTDIQRKQGGINKKKPERINFLCSLKILQFCSTYQIAEVIDGMFAFSPIYSIKYGNAEPVLFRLHENFGNYLNSFGVVQITIEAINKGRNQTFRLTKSGEKYQYQLEYEVPFYIRENFINVVAKTMFRDWDYLVWVDAHQYFHNNYWWEEAIYKAEHFATVQLFQYIHRHEYNNKTLEMIDPLTDLRFSPTMAGLQYMYKVECPLIKAYHLWSGNAWIVRREIYDQVGYIADECISGGCDHLWNYATFDKPLENWKDGFPWRIYREAMFKWVDNANKILRNKGAFLRGNISHFQHEHDFKFGLMLAGEYTLQGFNLMHQYRDENFQLHLNNSAAIEFYNQNR